MGLGLQLRDPGAITVAALAAGAAWAVGVRPPAAGALGLTVLAVKGLTGLALTRGGETAEVLVADAPTDIGPPERVATPPAAAPGTAEPGDTGVGDGHVFCRQGEVWRIGSGEAVFYLEDSKGLRDLHCLLRNPGQEVHVVQLDHQADGSGTPRQQAGLPEGTSVTGDDSLPVLDEKAKAEYRQRRRHLEAEREEAMALNDEGQLYRIELEIDALDQQILEATGLGGKDRMKPGQVRQIANNVTRRIGAAIKRIDEHDAALAHHLRSTVRRGVFCVYDPGPGTRPNWRL